MWTKENDYNKDKAIWVQKYEFAEKELREAEERLDSQKRFYVNIISVLKQSNSPIKSESSLQGPNAATIFGISAYESIEQDSKIRESIKKAETSIDQILLSDKIREEINS